MRRGPIQHPEFVDPTLDAYEQFLRKKICLDHGSGVDCDLDEIHPLLKDHQRLMVQWAIRGGRRALFALFGLGKTLMPV